MVRAEAWPGGASVPADGQARRPGRDAERRHAHRRRRAPERPAPRHHGAGWPGAAAHHRREEGLGGMSKAVEGAAMLAGAVGMGVAAFLDPALLATVWFDKVWASLIVGGISMEASAIGSALTQNRGMSITHRQPASLRTVVY